MSLRSSLKRGFSFSILAEIRSLCSHATRSATACVSSYMGNICVQKVYSGGSEGPRNVEMTSISNARSMRAWTREHISSWIPRYPFSAGPRCLISVCNALLPQWIQLSPASNVGPSKREIKISNVLFAFLQLSLSAQVCSGKPFNPWKSTKPFPKQLSTWPRQQVESSAWNTRQHAMGLFVSSSNRFCTIRMCPTLISTV